MNRIYDRYVIECFEQYLFLIKRDATNSKNLLPRSLTGKRSSKKCLAAEKFAEINNYLGNFLKQLSSKLELSSFIQNIRLDVQQLQEQKKMV